MKDLITILKEQKKLLSVGSASDQEVLEAEQELELSFSDEYKKYVRCFGAVSYFGHELTGVCSAPELSVVNVTCQQKAFNPLVPPNLYVVENTNFDGMVFWQDSNGIIYRSMPDAKVEEAYGSLAEYVEREHVS